MTKKQLALVLGAVVMGGVAAGSLNPRYILLGACFGAIVSLLSLR